MFLVTDLLWETMTHFPVGQTRWTAPRSGRSLWQTERTVGTPSSCVTVALQISRLDIYFQRLDVCLRSRLPTEGSHVTLTKEAHLPVRRKPQTRVEWKRHCLLAANMVIYSTYNISILLNVLKVKLQFRHGPLGRLSCLELCSHKLHQYNRTFSQQPCWHEIASKHECNKFN